MMRVRGYVGGFYLDALAAIDIALWDIAGKQAGKPLSALLGAAGPRRIEAYVSGLPQPSRDERAAFAQEWMSRGFTAFKYAAPVSDDGVVAEAETLRGALGSEARIACDMHWAHSAAEALRLIRLMEPSRLWFAEAPVRPEDIAGLLEVSAGVTTAIAAGEEWRTAHEMRFRTERGFRGIFQPEMGHIGITEFMRMVRHAEALGMTVIPHATIGLGIFLAASLHASAALSPHWHEFQHSVFEPNRHLIMGDMDCRDGAYTVPTAPGLGVEPNEDARRLFVECPQ
jgi:galactonate dehydratase